MFLRINSDLYGDKNDYEEMADFMLGFSYFEKEYYDCLEVDVVFVDDLEMQDINYKHLGNDYSTDVLSFPLLVDESILHYALEHKSQISIGSIVINVDEVRNVSADLRHSEIDEAKLLFIHAFLHILGFDHERDEGEHRVTEQRVIEHFGLPKSLICRNQN